MIALTEQQRKLVAETGGEPVPFIDEETRTIYYLVPAGNLDELKALISDEPFHPSEMYPLIWKTAAAAGWADPEMDIYDNYDEHRAKGAAG